MPTLNINTLFGHTDVDLPEDGTITEDVVDAFTRGHCHSFALAAAKATGWQLAGVKWLDPWEFADEIDDPDEWDDPGIPDHILVVAPDGTPYDVTGRYDATHDVEIIDEDFIERLAAVCYRRPEPAVAALYVPAWLQTIQEGALA